MLVLVVKRWEQWLKIWWWNVEQDSDKFSGRTHRCWIWWTLEVIVEEEGCINLTLKWQLTIEETRTASKVWQQQNSHRLWQNVTDWTERVYSLSQLTQLEAQMERERERKICLIELHFTCQNHNLQSILTIFWLVSQNTPQCHIYLWIIVTELKLKCNFLSDESGSCCYFHGIISISVFSLCFRPFNNLELICIPQVWLTNCWFVRVELYLCVREERTMSIADGLSIVSLHLSSDNRICLCSLLQSEPPECRLS